MAETMIEISNCNNIAEAKISITENTLNIKYGCNGTGKSTISEAIRLKSEGNSLEGLRPFTDEENNDINPVVNDIPFTKVKVFNEDYIKKYLFKSEGIFADSYSVLLQSKECEELAKKISDLLNELQSSFNEEDSISDLSNMLSEYMSVVNYASGSIAKRGGLGEFLKGNGAGFEKHQELDAYKPFYESDIASVSKWADWRTSGINHMNGDSCPFCTSNMDMPVIQKQNETIKKVFKKSAIKTATQVLEYLKKGIEKGYISKDAEKGLLEYLGDEDKADELYAELSQLAAETEYLQKKLRAISIFRPMNVTHDQLTEIEKSLKSMQIDRNILQKYYTTDLMGNSVDAINAKIEELLSKSGQLKGLFFQHESKLKKLIDDRKDDINAFFTLAGFPYKFEIKEDGERKANTYLIPFGKEKAVSEPDSHLSWGERNAFALVMFIFDAISENADLIVLDDPIAAFDNNKKFAVVRRMFDNQQEVTFRDKTVLMLTHDLQPVIDYIHGSFFKAYGLTTPVRADFISNENGVIKEQAIEDIDLLNTVVLTEHFAKDEDKPLFVRIVNYRKYYELTTSGFKESACYDILSNLIHGRSIPEDGQKQPMPQNLIDQGMLEISKYMPGYTYEKMIEELKSSNLIKEVSENSNMYYRILAIRLLFEREKTLLQQLKKEYPGACKFLNETNHIENDYVFQLNPEKYFAIPEVYVNEIRDFIDKHGVIA
ncbi:hypothetical protein SAMN04487928_12543 [Butyrivibrio proteoclasticus]|uniref:Protein CR006 P-loop domain-containing protein n=1 Tax=Butyrivibrio proteoclasticus TaxID=43305 RepID=A0A1I5WUK4_9FIRM|nr:hypothetical protein [Butyrivibrio proteoclasticus]SFQ23452.1 hypothetical protein SAMN04487928_12543 [Butyrivibrio proteoclasticus]